MFKAPLLITLYKDFDPRNTESYLTMFEARAQGDRELKPGALRLPHGERGWL